MSYFHTGRLQSSCRVLPQTRHLVSKGEPADRAGQPQLQGRSQTASAKSDLLPYSVFKLCVQENLA